MRKNHDGPSFAVLLGTFALFFRFPTVQAQCDQQPPFGTYSVPPSTTVYYSLDQSNLQNIPPGTTPPPPITQIQAAFQAWSTSNTAAGGSGTSFQPADANHPASVFVNSDATYQGSYVAQTQVRDGVITSSNPATITFHPNAFLAGASSNAFQASQSGYNSAYLQAALHELGHVNGIGDYNLPESAPPPGPASSVVGPFRGVNDEGDKSQKTTPTDCDKQQAATSSSRINATGGGGGKGGGDGGGGDGSCYSYV